MKQTVDGQLAGGDRVGDGIDQERHVVVDDPDPHPSPAGLAAGRFDRQLDFAAPPPGRDRGEELGCLALVLGGEFAGFAGQGITRQRLAN